MILRDCACGRDHCQLQRAGAASCVSAAGSASRVATLANTSRSKGISMKAILRSLAALALIGSGSVSAQSPAWPPVGEATGTRVAGRGLWGGLVTSDVARSSEFYASVFGWTFRNVPGAAGAPGYLTILANGRPIGGVVPKPPGSRGGPLSVARTRD